MPDLARSCTVTLRDGRTTGPLRASPMWDRVFFDPDGYHWDATGCLLSFDPGGALDVVKVTHAGDADG